MDGSITQRNVLWRSRKVQWAGWSASALLRCGRKQLLNLLGGYNEDVKSRRSLIGFGRLRESMSF